MAKQQKSKKAEADAGPDSAEPQDDQGDGRLPLDAQSKSAIVSCIHNLDKKDPENFDPDGFPAAEVLTEMCGFQVTDDDIRDVWGVEVGAAPAPTDSGEEETPSEYKPSPPLQIMAEFEQAMSGSRNAVLQGLLRDWQTSKKEAQELDQRLSKRGRF